MHGVIAGGVGAALMTVMGLMAASKNQTTGMIGVHIGMLLPVLFAAVFTKQAIKNFPIRDTDARFYLFVLMTLGSLASFMTILEHKPKKEKRTE